MKQCVNILTFLTLFTYLLLKHFYNKETNSFTLTDNVGHVDEFEYCNPDVEVPFPDIRAVENVNPCDRRDRVMWFLRKWVPIFNSKHLILCKEIAEELFIGKYFPFLAVLRCWLLTAELLCQYFKQCHDIGIWNCPCAVPGFNKAIEEIFVSKKVKCGPHKSRACKDRLSLDELVKHVCKKDGISNTMHRIINIVIGYHIQLTEDLNFVYHAPETPLDSEVMLCIRVLTFREVIPENKKYIHLFKEVTDQSAAYTFGMEGRQGFR